MAFADEIEAAVEQAARAVAPAVVGVGTRGPVGTGLVVGDGQVLTCAHNLRSPGRSLHFPDGRSATADQVHFDPELDLALVLTDTARLAAPPWAAAAPRLGSPVLALVNPGGRGARVTLGTVAAVDLPPREGQEPPGSGPFLHSAPCPPGSSGAPVLDLEGRVVGLNFQRDGVLYGALPATAELKERLSALARGEGEDRGSWLGVSLYPAPIARRLRQAVGLEDRPGALVREALEDGPAARSGLTQGDLLVAVGEAAVADPQGLHRVLSRTVPGTAVELRVVRQGAEVTLTATTEKMPPAPGAGRQFRRHHRRG